MLFSIRHFHGSGDGHPLEPCRFEMTKTTLFVWVSPRPGHIDPNWMKPMPRRSATWSTMWYDCRVRSSHLQIVNRWETENDWPRNIRTCTTQCRATLFDIVVSTYPCTMPSECPTSECCCHQSRKKRNDRWQIELKRHKHLTVDRMGSGGWLGVGGMRNLAICDGFI